MQPTAPGFAEHLADAIAGAMAPAAERFDAVRTDLHTAEEERRRANRINTGVLAVLAILVGLLAVLGVFTLRIASQARQTNQQVASCTTPGGACYERGQQQTGQAVDAIVRSSMYAVECARELPGQTGPGFDQAMEKCIAGKLSAAAHPSPSPKPSGSGAP